MGMAKSSLSFSMKYVIRFLILRKREREGEGEREREREREEGRERERGGDIVCVTIWCL